MDEFQGEKWDVEAILCIWLASEPSTRRSVNNLVMEIQLSFALPDPNNVCLQKSFHSALDFNSIRWYDLINQEEV